MESYRTVRGFAESRFTEKKSVFIGQVLPCQTWEEATDFVDAVKKQYPDANHHVVAFLNREGNVQRFDDDGEPKGTGGLPMMEVLKKESLSGVCAVVTRYFGGILLGASGLARAYARGARDAVQTAGICRFSKAYLVKAEIPYPLFDKASFVLQQKQISVTEKSFGEGVTLSLLLSPAQRDFCASYFSDLSGGKITLITEGETFAEDREDRFDR